MKFLRDAFLIVILSAAFGILANIIRNSADLNGLAMDTPWPDNREKVELDIPPSYMPCDSANTTVCDSLISLEQAYALYLKGDAIFVDTREEFEYDEGHIAGAINLPFEFWDDYWEIVEPQLDPGKVIVTYCGGLDCELSLFAARELKSLGYEHAYIFFGGWHKWLDAGLAIEETEYNDDEDYEEYYENESVGDQEGDEEEEE
jgi:rhodanese-related sulfurtransferase